MKRLVCEEPGHFAFAEVAEPEPGPGEALLRMRRVGVCGTDLHAYRGRQPFFTYPRVLGHELSAEILEIGENERGLSAGDAVVVNPYLACGHCRPCRSGRSNCCSSLRVLGVHVDGGLSERLALPSSQLLRADGLEPNQMAIVECLGIGAHAVRRSGLGEGDLAVVVGAGPIGMGVVQFARLAGAEVVAVDRDEDRLAYTVETLGARYGVVAGDGVMERLAAATGDDLASYVFDATGSAASMRASFDFAGPGATYVLVSLVQGEIGFDDPEFHRKELSLLSSRNATPGDLETVISAMRDGAVETESFITHRAAFADVPSVFDSWLEPESGVIKAMIEL